MLAHLVIVYSRMLKHVSIILDKVLGEPIKATYMINP
jgi:hypothetical protein